MCVIHTVILVGALYMARSGWASQTLKRKADSLTASNKRCCMGGVGNHKSDISVFSKSVHKAFVFRDPSEVVWDDFINHKHRSDEDISGFSKRSKSVHHYNAFVFRDPSEVV